MQKKEESKRHVFFIAKKDAPIFDYLKNGKKKVETRAATVRNARVQAGDIAVFLCNKKRLEKNIKKVAYFKTVAGMLKKYKAKTINPEIKNDKELTAMYHSFPGYRDKIKEFGILAFELE